MIAVPNPCLRQVEKQRIRLRIKGILGFVYFYLQMNSYYACFHVSMSLSPPSCYSSRGIKVDMPLKSLETPNGLLQIPSVQLDCMIKYFRQLGLLLKNTNVSYHYYKTLRTSETKHTQSKSNLLQSYRSKNGKQVKIENTFHIEICVFLSAAK